MTLFSKLNSTIFILVCVVILNKLTCRLMVFFLLLNDEAFLKTVHHILLEVRLIEGTLVCPESGRKFPVKNSIPNMLLNEDEV